MELKLNRGWCFTSLLFSFFVLSYAQRANDISAESLDSIIRDCAFKALVRRRTGVVYDVPLPSNLSGIVASVVRLRSRTFWSAGENMSAFHIPPGTLPMPYVKRLVLVYQNWRNWSSLYYRIPEYSLVAPVMGLLAYDASNTSSSVVSNKELNLRVTGDAISLSFPKIKLLRGLNSTMKCARFSLHRSVQLENVTREKNLCFVKNTGHFAIVVPSTPTTEQGRRWWWTWVVACGGGVIVLLFLSLVGVGVAKLVRRKKMEEMGSKADEDEALETTWARGVRCLAPA